MNPEDEQREARDRHGGGRREGENGGGPGEPGIPGEQLSEQARGGPQEEVGGRLARLEQQRREDPRRPRGRRRDEEDERATHSGAVDRRSEREGECDAEKREGRHGTWAGSG